MLPAFCRADVWTLSTSDFLTDTVVFHGIEEHGVAVTSVPSQDARTVPLDRFLEITRVIPIRQRSAPFVLQLRDGDVLAGEPVSLSGDAIVWREDIIGNMTVPLSQAIAFRRAGEPQLRSQPRSAPAALDDAVKLANGDAVHGVLSDLSATSVSITPSAGGDATAVPIGNVKAVEFASVSGATTTTSPSASAESSAFQIRLSDGSLLTAASVHGDDWTLHLKFASSPDRDVPLSAIQSIEQINGPAVWLSSLGPSENVQTPFLEAEYPAQFDRNVLGGPIQFGGRVYAHGIGVHAYSRLSWVIDPLYTHFRTQYAVDGDVPYADLTVQIKLDGTIVHQRKGLRAGELSPVVELDVSGKHTLTMEAIDDQNDGVQARLNWIDPAFVRRAAISTTTP